MPRFGGAFRYEGLTMPRFVSGTHRGRVLCDGAELKDVIEVDTDLGFAIVTVRDEAGNLRIKGDEFERKLVLGKMQFIEHIDASEG